MRNNTSSYYRDMLDNIRDRIFDDIRYLMKELGGKVCLYYYHDYDIVAGYTYFEVNGDGYGVELFINTMEMDNNGNVSIYLVDTEDSYDPTWELADLNYTDALYVLEELEQVKEHIDRTGKKVVTEYDGDEDPEE